MHTTGNHETDRKAAAEWAWRMLQSPDAVILDTETTGLDSRAEIVQIAIMTMRGDVLLDTLVKPVGTIPPDASRIHGITLKTVEHAESFLDVAPAIYDILKDRTCLIYNRDYDWRPLKQSAQAHGKDPFISLPSTAKFECVMLPYSAYVGEVSSWATGYKWQRLPSGDHSALGDVIATRKLIFQMAGLGWLCD